MQSSRPLQTQSSRPERSATSRLLTLEEAMVAKLLQSLHAHDGRHGDRNEEPEKRVIVQCTARLGNHPTSPQCRRDAVDGKFCTQHQKKIKDNMNSNSSKKSQRKIQKMSDEPGAAMGSHLDSVSYVTRDSSSAQSASSASKAAANAMELVKRLRDAGFGVGLGGALQAGLPMLNPGSMRPPVLAAPPPVPVVPMGPMSNAHAEEVDGQVEDVDKVSRPHPEFPAALIGDKNKLAMLLSVSGARGVATS